MAIWPTTCKVLATAVAVAQLLYLLLLCLELIFPLGCSRGGCLTLHSTQLALFDACESLQPLMSGFSQNAECKSQDVGGICNFSVAAD